MSGTKNTRRWLMIAAWAVIGSGVLVLLIAAMNRKNATACKGYEIEISGVSNNFFIDKKDVLNLLTANGAEKLEGRSASSLDLRRMETLLEKNLWIRKAELFFDNNGILKISIVEREPVARIFTNSGATFYIDSAGERLPLSDKLSARVPVFTGFPTDKTTLGAADSLLLVHIRTLSNYIAADSFWMAQIAQVDITDKRQFELLPLVGNHIIEFGDGEQCAAKFNRLFTFYRKVLSQTGFDAYSRIKVQYERQVIGVKRGQEAPADTNRVRQLLEQVLARNNATAADSVITDTVRAVVNTPVAIPATPNRNTTPVTNRTTPATAKPVVPKPAPPKPNVNTPARPANRPPVSNPSGRNQPNNPKPKPKPTQPPRAVMPARGQ
jgi:cell division protein FtsQ